MVDWKVKRLLKSHKSTMNNFKYLLLEVVILLSSVYLQEFTEICSYISLAYILGQAGLENLDLSNY